MPSRGQVARAEGRILGVVTAAHRRFAARGHPALVRLPFFGSGILSFADQGLISGGNFFSAVVLARALETHEFGLYTVINTAIWFTVAVQNGLILQPLVIRGA